MLKTTASLVLLIIIFCVIFYCLMDSNRKIRGVWEIDSHYPDTIVYSLDDSVFWKESTIVHHYQNVPLDTAQYITEITTLPDLENYVSLEEKNLEKLYYYQIDNSDQGTITVRVIEHIGYQSLSLHSPYSMVASEVFDGGISLSSLASDEGNEVIDPKNYIENYKRVYTSLWGVE